MLDDALVNLILSRVSVSDVDKFQDGPYTRWVWGVFFTGEEIGKIERYYDFSNENNLARFKASASCTQIEVISFVDGLKFILFYNDLIVNKDLKIYFDWIDGELDLPF